VHTEKWQLFRGWQRISADAEVISPSPHKLYVDSLGWVGSTPAGGVDVGVVEVNAYNLESEIKNNSAKWTGSALLMIHKGAPPARDQRMKMFAEYGNFLRAAYAAHAMAVIGGQGGSDSTGMHLTHTGILGFEKYYQIPVVSITPEGASLLRRLLDHGGNVRIHIDVQNRVTSGPVPSANVVGEIPGTKNPEQVIVVGGHLDSWDLSDGATDDGVGAAQAIVQSGYKPLRTLRFVLFTGEEQGLLGSLAYVKAHKAEIGNHVAAVILDNGQGPVVTLNLGGRQDLIPAVEAFAKSVSAFGKVKVDDRTSFGTDAGPFILQGLPGINMNQNSPDYEYTHHSVVDTFDKVDPAILSRDATLMGLTAFWIADRPDRIASPWPPTKTAQMLVKKKADAFLKAAGLWPFGTLGSEPAKPAAARQ
jgi:carboxypeptidase Q